MRSSPGGQTARLVLAVRQLALADGVPQGEGLHPGLRPGGEVEVHVDADLAHGGAGSLHAEQSPGTQQVRVGPTGGGLGDVRHGLGVTRDETAGDGDLVLRLPGLHGGPEGVEVEVVVADVPDVLAAAVCLVEGLAAAGPGEVGVGVGRSGAAGSDGPGAQLESGHDEGRGLSGPVSLQRGRTELPQRGARPH